MLINFTWNCNVSTSFPELSYVTQHDQSKFQQEHIQNIRIDKDLGDYLGTTSQTGQLIRYN